MNNQNPELHELHEALRIHQTSHKSVSEKTVKANLVKKLNQIPGCFVKRREATSGLRGQPDITGIINGIRLELEIKVNSAKPTEKQKNWIRKWESYGAIAGCYETYDEIVEHINRYFTQRFNKKII